MVLSGAINNNQNKFKVFYFYRPLVASKMAFRTLPITAFAIVATLAFASGYDHEAFNDCSEVPLCSDYRNLPRQSRYELDETTITVVGNDAIFTLNNLGEGSDLRLSINGIEGADIIRLRIDEVDSDRYKLTDILDGEPENIPLSPPTISDSIILDVGDNRIELTSSPLSISIYRGEVLQLAIDGERLLFENTEEAKPFFFGLSYPQATHLYGLHEHCDTLSLRTTEVDGPDPYRLKNLDVAAGHEINSTLGLYGAIPVLYGHGARSTSGVFLQNAAEIWVETKPNAEGGSEAFFMVDSGSFDLFVLLGPSPADVVKQYAKLTGVAYMPQLWTLGYHQSRFGYLSQEDVATVLDRMDIYDFPMDAIWLDMYYTDGSKWFTWNPLNFTDPQGMLSNIAGYSNYLVVISDPHIKVEVGYSVYDGLEEGNLFMKYADGSDFVGPCWPGDSSYIDFLNPEAVEYYANLYSYDEWQGTSSVLGGIWNDMNEPSVFYNTFEKTIPNDLVHFGGVRHGDVHNIYGLLQTRATNQGLMNRDEGSKRPFILTRSHFPSSQRYAAIWTGDNTAGWDFLRASWAMCLNANILGISFCGSDVGGFLGDPDLELLERWYQAGVWLPFYRAHSDQNSQRREPYLLPDDGRIIVRNAIRLRYSHIPYFYTIFYEHTITGEPVIRPLFYQYPEDENVFHIDDQLLVGRDILVKQITEPGVTSVPIYFPGGEDQVWWSMQADGSVFRGNGWTDVPVTIDYSPVYYRAGSIITTKTAKRTTTEMSVDFHNLYIIHDSDLLASGNLFIDDFVSFDYRDRNAYNYVRIEATGTRLQVTQIDNNADADNFPINISMVFFVDPLTMKKSNGANVRGFNATADGTPLSSINFNKKSIVLQFA